LESAAGEKAEEEEQKIEGRSGRKKGRRLKIEDSDRKTT
jgi:hypothetical protein